jgi:esterase/lipase superfamily enzyme
MELLLFGHAGARLLVFPTSMGRFFEWEDQGMTAALHEHLANGWIQMCCVDSVDNESWYAKWKHPADRARRQSDYERYIFSEVLPFIYHQNPNPFLIVAGASFGAYHAINFAFRYPDRVNRVIGLSGLYDIKEMTGGYEDESVYQHDPSHYLVHLQNSARLDAIRRMDVILAIGATDPNRGNNDYLSGVLWGKGVWHALRIWDGWAHDWPWWRQMIRHYIGGSD